MAVAFVDDSGSGGDAPYFVLAGYVASEAAWNKFVTDWQAVLDLSPKLEYFKMKEAEGLRGQFASFTPPQRDSRLHLFIDVILQCDPWEASISVPAKDHYEVLYPILPKTRSSPYYSAFIAMVTALSGFYRWSGSDETVDYIFDQQPGIENRAASLYFNFRTWRPEWRLGRVGFADEKKVLPLQAADLIAWQTRRFMCSKEGTRDTFKRLHSVRPPFRKTLKRGDLEDAANAILANIRNLRAAYGDERVDRELATIERRNSSEGISD